MSTPASAQGADRQVQAPWCRQCGRALADGGHDGCDQRAELEPPRWCGQCRRRMVVQVVPRGWWATCVEHGRQQGPAPG